MPLNQPMAEQLEGPSEPEQYLSILVIHQALEDAAGTGHQTSIADRLDAINFVRGDWRLALWCDAARIMPELVQQAAVIVEPPLEGAKFGVKLDLETAREIRAQRAAGVLPWLLVKRYGVGDDAIRAILNGKAWREVTG